MTSQDKKVQNVTPSAFLDNIIKSRASQGASIDEFKFKKARCRVLTRCEEIKPSSKGVFYWMCRDFRVQDNWAMLYSQRLARKHKIPLYVGFFLGELIELYPSTRQFNFLIEGLKHVEKELQTLNIPFYAVNSSPMQITEIVKQNDIGTVVCDFFPLRQVTKLQDTLVKQLPQDVPLVQVDAHNIVPCWIASEKQEIAARTIRPKIVKKLPEFLTNFPPVCKQEPCASIKISKLTSLEEMKKQISRPHIDEIKWGEPGPEAGFEMLRSFILERLKYYGVSSNDPSKNHTSNLSPWIHFGHISAQRCALEVKVYEKRYKEQAEKYLEELIVRKELSDNFCAYNPKYDQLEGADQWARITLNLHRQDKRDYIYSVEELEEGRSHDIIWNAAQTQLVGEGKLHGYMRMYWCKKILEWTESPEKAIEIALKFNDNYSIDGSDPNGFLWQIRNLVMDRRYDPNNFYPEYMGEIPPELLGLPIQFDGSQPGTSQMHPPIQQPLYYGTALPNVPVPITSSAIPYSGVGNLPPPPIYQNTWANQPHWSNQHHAPLQPHGPWCMMQAPWNLLPQPIWNVQAAQQYQWSAQCPWALQNMQMPPDPNFRQINPAFSQMQPNQMADPNYQPYQQNCPRFPAIEPPPVIQPPVSAQVPQVLPPANIPSGSMHPQTQNPVFHRGSYRSRRNRSRRHHHHQPNTEDRPRPTYSRRPFRPLLDVHLGLGNEPRQIPRYTTPIITPVQTPAIYGPSSSSEVVRSRSPVQNNSRLCPLSCFSVPHPASPYNRPPSFRTLPQVTKARKRESSGPVTSTPKPTDTASTSGSSFANVLQRSFGSSSANSPTASTIPTPGPSTSFSNVFQRPLDSPAANSPAPSSIHTPGPSTSFSNVLQLPLESSGANSYAGNPIQTPGPSTSSPRAYAPYGPHISHSPPSPRSPRSSHGPKRYNADPNNTGIYGIFPLAQFFNEQQRKGMKSPVSYPLFQFTENVANPPIYHPFEINSAILDANAFSEFNSSSSASYFSESNHPSPSSYPGEVSRFVPHALSTISEVDSADLTLSESGRHETRPEVQVQPEHHQHFIEPIMRELGLDLPKPADSPVSSTNQDVSSPRAEDEDISKPSTSTLETSLETDSKVEETTTEVDDSLIAEDESTVTNLDQDSTELQASEESVAPDQLETPLPQDPSSRKEEELGGDMKRLDAGDTHVQEELPAGELKAPDEAEIDLAYQAEADEVINAIKELFGLFDENESNQPALCNQNEEPDRPSDVTTGRQDDSSSRADYKPADASKEPQDSQ